MAILELIEQHEAKLIRMLNLVASENLVSEDVRRALSSDVSMRYCIPPEGERPAAIWDYPNQEQIHLIAKETERLSRELFHASYADSRPLSGNQIALIILTTLVSAGDTVWSVPADCGGHFATPVIANRYGLKLVQLPYDYERGVIDIEAARTLAKKCPPKLIFLDASMQLFPHPVAELRDAVGPDPIISFDASHTLGLIAGGSFQSPLQEGADLLHGSTHKSLWGPQKGLITVRDQGRIAELIHEAVVPMFVSNIHVHHVAALGVALEEARDYGAAYSQAVISNAKELANSLSAEGIDVLFQEIGATESHQIIIDVGEKQDSIGFWNRLQSVGLNANAISLPFRKSFGLRLGVAEVTRRGFGAPEMQQVARLISACAKRNLSTADIAAKVAELSEQYALIRYARNFTPIN
jgi:glycine hydroxymethyltransferase